MKKIKLEKGITLIALIITIVVLLILAAVTIGSVRESGIIGHAQNASSEYTIAQEKERIALAYSEYQIQKTLNSEIEPDTLSVNEATIEPISDLGWKVTYSDTGNVYGINSKGEYDDAITMIIEASEETGVSVDKFIIFEDKYAINANKTSGTITMPERYVFYNWGEVTEDERKVLELYEPTTPSTELVENASNRMLILDTNSDGEFIYEFDRTVKYEKSDNRIIDYLDNGYINHSKMTNEIHNFYSSICYYTDENGEEKKFVDYLVANMGEDSFSILFYCFLWDFNEDFTYGDYDEYMYYIYNGEKNPSGNGMFNDAIYNKHVYYTSPRYEADFE